MKSKLNIAKLSRDEKLKLLDLIEAKREASLRKIDVFKPHAGQLPILISNAMEKFVFCANAFGKTALAVNQMLYWAKGFNPLTGKHTRVPSKIIIVLDKPEKVADVWLPEIKKWYGLEEEQLRKNGKPYYNQISFPNGSEVKFMFQDAEPMSFESLELDYAIFDEPPHRHIYFALMRGTRKKFSQPKMLLVGTPLKAAWLRTDILVPWTRGELPTVECFKGTAEFNRDNLADGYLERFSARLSDKERRIRMHGEFFDLDGLALSHLFNRDIHVVDNEKLIKDFKENQWPCVVSVDPHPRKKTHAILMGCDPKGNLFVLKEMAAKKVAREYAIELFNFTSGFRVVDWVCDSLGSADMTAGEGFKSFIQVLNDCGIRIRPTTFKEKDDESFISRIQDALYKEKDLAHPKLRLYKDCIGSISDLEQVQWLKVRNSEELKNKLDISNKDYLSCIKYALATNIGTVRTRGRIIMSKVANPWKNR